MARGLTAEMARLGHHTRLLVGLAGAAQPSVEPMPDDDRLPFRACGYTMLRRALLAAAARRPASGFGLAARALRLVAHPRAAHAIFRGREDHEFPSTARLVRRLETSGSVLHLHNLHGGFFDLRALGPLSAAVPTFITLHDMWLLTGHCAHALSCERWTHGCGACPDLSLAPALRRDGTADNWLLKARVFAGSRLRVAAPSEWMASRVRRSMLGEHARDVRVIPNGVDTRVFAPGDRAAAREALGLPAGAHVVLLTTGGAGSSWKDDQTMAGVAQLLSVMAWTRPLVFLSVGRRILIAGLGAGAVLRTLPYEDDELRMARVFQAADVYLHASRADTAPLAVLEAMACGTPVVATRVGGIPEQVSGEETGTLVGAGDAGAMAAAARRLLVDDQGREACGDRAVARVRARFTRTAQAGAYLEWYMESVEAA